MRLWITCMIAIAALVFAAAAAADGAQVVRVPFRLSNAAQTDIAACIGERLSVTDGAFNVVTHFTPTVFTFHRNVVGAEAVGVITGTAYHLTGHLQDTDVLTAGGNEIFT